MNLLKHAAIGLIIAGSAACDATSPVGSGALASIVVTPRITLAIAATQQFVAEGKDAAGMSVTISPTWSLAGGGTINDAGLFSAGTTSGTFVSTVTASSGAISGRVSVTVTNGAIINTN